ncbi:SDR family oxidoreductase [Promicromonospora vindobonensis]|uniref:SDR family oxidoreductase n=1 Tax=Promicromonospora vindobonensis TaxID=195748 RepID=A0ABW5VVR7_9MICO
MTATILVTGGTGTLGRHVVPLLRAAGRDVRVLSRTPHASRPGVEHVAADLSTGAGVVAAVTGVDTIIHLAGSNKGDGDKTRTLVEAARAAGSPHLVYISVVGADRVPVTSGVDRAAFGYIAEKRAAELVVEQSGLPWTTLRATQFHDLVLTLVEALSKLPVAPSFSGYRIQPIEAAEVADRLVELALAEPSGLAPDLGGPHVYEMRDLLRSYLDAAGRRRPILSIRQPGGAARALREGAGTAPDRAVGLRTWEEFLADRVGVAGRAASSR